MCVYEQGIIIVLKVDFVKVELWSAQILRLYQNIFKICLITCYQITVIESLKLGFKWSI